MTSPILESDPNHPSVSDADLANALRFLAMDAVERAKSGHPGMPMGMADVMLVLARDVLVFDAGTPRWPDRDRLVLSAGHGSMLLYAFAYLSGFADMSIEDLRHFRQWQSRTAGHPELGHADCVETTTGPLGQGLATAVGMALAERKLAHEFGSELSNHYTYVMVGDGCLMEGISHEAVSLAGHLALERLIVLFDSNRISIDGPTALTVSDDHRARFNACGWHVQDVDGHDPQAVLRAIEAAKAQKGRPSMIECRTIIGRGAPSKQGSAATHGAPLGAEEIAATRKALQWTHAPFVIPENILLAWRSFGQRGVSARQAWEERYRQHPQEAEWNRRLRGELPKDWDRVIRRCTRTWVTSKPKWATRQASGETLEELMPVLPELIGGSADLTGSNNTLPKKGALPIAPPDYAGRYMHYGVREFGMAALMNGLSCHGGFIPYGGTFLVFSDYCRSAIRLSALMGQGVIYVMTHDSVALGEDGPTHQPIEHVASLRAMPGVLVLRPGDAVETAECWQIALSHRDCPSILCLSRQGIETFRTRADDNLCAAGAYEVVGAPKGRASLTIIASGSEVSLALAAREALQQRKIAARVVSMPCWELFEQLDEDQRVRILGPQTYRIAIEAASPLGWERYTLGYQSAGGAIIGIDHFGASAPGDTLMRQFNFTVDHVVDTACRLCQGGK